MFNPDFSARRAILFEFLRQQNLSDRTADRLRWRGGTTRRDSFRDLRAAAERSWASPSEQSTGR